MTGDFYERAIRRIVRFALAVGLAGVVTVLIVRGPREAAGFLLGTVLSSINFLWWKRVTSAAGPQGESRLRVSTVFLALRYLFIGGAIYAIVKLLKITPAAILAGLLVSIAAVILEALYELIYART